LRLNYTHRISNVYNTPGRTLRLLVFATGYTDYGPDRRSDGRLVPHIVPQPVTVVIYGTPG
jgi:hypothetical protein